MIQQTVKEKVKQLVEKQARGRYEKRYLMPTWEELTDYSKREHIKEEIQLLLLEENLAIVDSHGAFYINGTTPPIKGRVILLAPILHQLQEEMK